VKKNFFVGKTGKEKHKGLNKGGGKKREEETGWKREVNGDLGEGRKRTRYKKKSRENPTGLGTSREKTRRKIDKIGAKKKMQHFAQGDKICKRGDQETMTESTTGKNAPVKRGSKSQ